MADVHTPETRSFNMSRIRSKDTKPEMRLRSGLHRRGLRYRLHSKKLPGKPDLSFRKYRTAVFVNGCFWHGHQGCPKFVMPKTRTEWWENKISRTRERDAAAYAKLRASGWKVIVVWECELRGDEGELALNRVFAEITDNNPA
ncbi:T/G mismatch-specific endonuclease [Cyclonatronum proteinivorum]|uniref:Very short patch repair endonuclease n=1 Tax=Cyclonatronum proteinivorum TaxID=1457365 RepID=A0A345UI29_9BACT|nr:very short patch repair endonuclease [Cyclonatronum proteinivorum]AXJ00131.1 T/G mismatch-specific endonuclease [Cyclonatronum proteinivorum]